MRTPMPPPPNFDRMLHSRTGVHTYGGDFSNFGDESNFGGMMGGMQKETGNQNARMGGYDNQEYGGYGQSEDFATPARKVMKQSARYEGSDGTATPVGKKTKKKSQGTTTSGAKQNPRKDSVRGGELNGEQHALAAFDSNFDHFGNITIANDTGRGYGPNFSSPFPTYPPAPPPTNTASPRDIENNNFMAGLPSMTYKHTNNANSTGITPQFNHFSFDAGDHNTVGDGLIMPTTESGPGSFDPFGVGNSFSGDGLRGLNSTHNASFASSNETSAAGSLSDQTLPRMQFSGHDEDAAGLGLGGPWTTQASDVAMSMDLGMEMETGDEKAQEHDMFSLLNEAWH